MSPEPTTRDEVKALYRAEVAGWASVLVAEALAAARAGELGLTRLGRVVLDAQAKGDALIDRIVDTTAEAMKRANTVKVVPPEAKAIGDGKPGPKLATPETKRTA